MDTEFKTNWTKDELKTYLLIFCANADFTESKAEIEFIKSSTDGEHFNKMHEEFSQDNDYISIQKLRLGFERHDYSNADIDKILSEVKALFRADGSIDVLEKNLLISLKRIFQ